MHTDAALKELAKAAREAPALLRRRDVAQVVRTQVMRATRNFDPAILEALGWTGAEAVEFATSRCADALPHYDETKGSLLGFLAARARQAVEAELEDVGAAL